MLTTVHKVSIKHLAKLQWFVKHILKAQANLVEWHKMLSECHHRLSCKFLKFIWLQAGSTLVVDIKTVEFTCQQFFKAAVVRLSLGVCTLHLIEGYSVTLPDMLFCQNVCGTTSKLKMARDQKAQRVAGHLEVVHGYLQTPETIRHFPKGNWTAKTESALRGALAGALTRTKDG